MCDAYVVVYGDELHMRESVVETYLVKLVVAAGGVCIKMTPMGDAGWLDRCAVLPGVVGFIELKAPGKEPSMLQLYRIKQLTDRGIVATWTDSLAGVEWFVQRLIERAHER